MHYMYVIYSSTCYTVAKIDYYAFSIYARLQWILDVSLCTYLNVHDPKRWKIIGLANGLYGRQWFVWLTEFVLQMRFFIRSYGRQFEHKRWKLRKQRTSIVFTSKTGWLHNTRWKNEYIHDVYRIESSVPKPRLWVRPKPETCLRAERVPFRTCWIRTNGITELSQVIDRYSRKANASVELAAFLVASLGYGCEACT